MPLRSPRSEEEYESWRTDSHSLTIEYSLMVLEELRLAGEAGFQKIAHGGVEVGALLMGLRDGDRVRIEEWRPIECEHARGPGFLLSQNDLAGLERLIGQTATAPELNGLYPVGWFHTHTRSKVFFSPEDKSIQDLFFPESWQVALVLQLTKDHAASAGFFVRDSDGGMRMESSYREFAVRPNSAMLLRPRRETALARIEPEALPASQPAAQDNAPSRRRGPSHRQQLWDEPPPVPRTSLESQPPPAALPQERIVAAIPQVKLLLPAFVLVLVAGAAVLTKPYWMPEPAPAIALRVEEIEDQIVIRWDLKSEVVRQAERGTLQIIDAGHTREIALDALEARAGSVTLMREGEDVQVRLALFRTGQPAVEEFARFLGSPVKAELTGQLEQAEQDKQQLATDVDRLKEALQQEALRSQRLRNSVKGLEDRLRQDEGRNRPSVP
ncbi:MAG: hypothetical protein JJE04_00675 [Acidobacteriia bacterium]|nr:hypothetical protein [Terriglobia bacterium]